MPRAAAKTPRAKKSDDAPAVERPALPTLPFVGNAAAAQLLGRLATAGTLAHAYLLVGPAGVGKRTLALRTAASVLGATPASVLAHPDFLHVERERDAKTDKLHAAVTIAQARELVGRLSLAAFAGGWRVAVLDGADTLQAEAANALLKTIEEPGARTVLFLLAESGDRVLPTIRSRCQTFRLNAVSEADIVDALVAAKVYRPVAEEAAKLSGGRPGVAMGLAYDAEALAAARERRRGLGAFSASSFADRARAVDAALPAKQPYQEARESAAGLLDELAFDAAGRGDFAVAGRCLEAKVLLASNASPRLAVEWAVLH
jgi:DNA polymerase-3 subunit delta'